MNYIEVLEKQKKILEEKGYTVAYICLYGSQNYKLNIHTEEYQSDIDMKAVVVPTLDELVKNSKPVSEVLDTEWGQVELKDIRKFTETLLKANPTYIEALFTDYYVVDEKFESDINEILNYAPELLEALKCQFIKAIYGMMTEKKKAMTHPYPTIKHKIDKWGFDGKQVSHLYRLKLMAEDYFVKKLPYYECLVPDFEDVELLLNLKLNKLPLEEIEPLAEQWINEVLALREEILSSVDESKIDYSIKYKYLEWSNNIIKKNIEKEIIQDLANRLLEDYK